MSRPRLIALLLALVTLVVYLPVKSHDFVNYDDDDYITNNTIVQHGLTWAGIKWAFTTWHASNWHPLTWLSHMADCQLFGPNAGAQHFVSVLFHAANAVLLFALLLRLTSLRADASARQADLIWPSAFVAALFAWHPLHVESVAWLAERKDVLSTFFALLTLLAYVKAVTSDKWRVTSDAEAASRVTRHASFFPALIFFALGLMSKPMLVTLPFVMLLLDFWPLKRIAECGVRSAGSSRPATFNRLLIEKIPFFLLTVISCVVTFLAQRGGDAVVSLEKVSLHYRLENIPVAFARYLLKMFWPADLAVIYPMPDKIPAIAVTASVAILIFISAVAWLLRRRSPYLIAGWLWFLGTLVPVIGLVQVGGAALADRYTYIPSIGIFIAVAFGACELAGRFQLHKIILYAVATLLLGACLILTGNQLRYWQDSESLFRHAVTVTKNNDIAIINLGVALDVQGRFDEALVYYREALPFASGRYQIHNNIANVLDKSGRPQEALAEYREAIRLNPKAAFLHVSQATVFVELGRFEEAMAECTNATRLDPGDVWSHFQMGKILLKQGRDAVALDKFREALRLDPDNFQVLAYTAHVLAADENPQIRDGQSALILAAKANALTGGTQPFVLDALGMACAEAGHFDDAQQITQHAFDLGAALKIKNLEPLQQRLELYKNHQPWRESFLATNDIPVKN